MEYFVVMVFNNETHKLAYSLTPNMEVTCSSNILVNFPQTAWYYVPEDGTLSVKKCFKMTSVNTTNEDIYWTKERPEQRHV